MKKLILENKNNLLSFLVLFSAIFIAYSNVYNFDFVYDDEFFIVKNTYLNSFSHIGDIFSTSSTGGAGFKDSFYRPVQFFLYLVVKSLFGGEGWAFHALNLLIHFFNAFLIFLLATKMRFAKPVALMIALLWCLHPIHTECVAYKSATADGLHTLFLLFGLNLMLPQAGLGSYVAGFFSFLLALLSKETAVLGPLVLTSCVFYFSEQRWQWRTYLKTAPFWILSLTYTLLRKTVLNFDGDFSFYKQGNVYTDNALFRLYTFFATLPSYLKLLLWPQDLHIDRNFPVFAEPGFPLVIAGMVMCALAFLMIAACVYFRSGKFVFPTFVILWFASTHFLHSGVLLPLNSLFLEHWMYMPSIAFFLAIGGVIQWLWNVVNMRLVVAPLVLGLCVVLGNITYVQNRVWANSISLFSHILSLNPKVARARHGLAMAYSDLGENSKALELYEAALKEQPYPQTYHNMALLYVKQDRLDKAEEYLLKALEMNPEFFPSYPYLIELYRVTGRPEKYQEYQTKFAKLKEGK